MTLHHLTTWPDFDDDGEPMSETVIGSDITPIAIVLAGNHHDAFLRLALAAPELLEALTNVANLLITTGYGNTREGQQARAAIAKAKGE